VAKNAPEAILQSQVIQLAKMNGFVVHHSRNVQLADGRWMTAISGNAGFPDLVLAHPERGVLFIELKSDTGKLTPGQVAWRNAFNGQVEYWMVRPADLDKLAKRLGRAPR
jgi:hypothetical protein